MTRRQSFLSGAAILAGAVAVTKVLGALYKIPLGNLLDSQGMAHFYAAYNVYNLLLMLSTAGPPLAASRLVAQAEALGRHSQARRVFRCALALLGGRGKTVILEIDPPVDDISIRRLHFYERLGFVANPYQYIHPSFRKPFTPHRLVLMSYPGAITYEEARSFADFVREAVLRYSEHEAPTLPNLA